MTGTILTIGYERAGFAALLATLQDAGVEAVIDVRELPNSRRAGFSKTMLASNLASAGITYAHMKALGTPKAGRTAHREGDMATFWTVVDAALDRPEAHLALAHAAVMAKGKRTCLMCLEHDWRVCHRARVCEMLERSHGLRALHLAVEA